jgi:hypothetical protein
MMVFVDRILNLSNEDLLRLVNEKSNDCTEEVLRIAREEIERRGLSGKTVEGFINEQDEQENYNNISGSKIATTIKLIGALEIFIGILASIYFLGERKDVATGMVIMVSVFVVGVILIGFGQIINLLHEINERQKSYLVSPPPFSERDTN